MRVNRATLLKIANDATKRSARQDRSIFAAYLCGSLLGDRYLIGGTTDIDLTFIHTGPVEQPREIIRLTDEIHLDIGHYDQKSFRDPRQLRVDPWLGPTIFDCQVLYDPQHFIDFTQASVRGQFHRADYVLERSRTGVDTARKIWFAFYRDVPDTPSAADILKYLNALKLAVNGVASLGGAPLTDRGLAVIFADRSAGLGYPGLHPGLLGLLGAPQVSPEQLLRWIGDWQQAYEAQAIDNGLCNLHLHRLHYYLQAIESLIARQNPENALWPLFYTWTQAVTQLLEDADYLEPWNRAGQELGLLGAAFAERIIALDAYLDSVEEILEKYARANGVE
jgi:hypothetical protein